MDIKWRVKVTYEATVYRNPEGETVDPTEEAVRFAALYPLSGKEHREQETKNAAAEVIAVQIDGKWYEAPPF